jgi:hypothetical protein
VRGLDVALFVAITAVYVLALWNVLPRSSEKQTRHPDDHTHRRR